MRNFDTTLYFITDSTGFSEEEFLRRIEEALKGGATILQLREKDKTTREALNTAIAPFMSDAYVYKSIEPITSLFSFHGYKFKLNERYTRTQKHKPQRNKYC